MMHPSPVQEESGTRFPPFLFVLLLLAASGCSKPEENGTVVARVNDRTLTMQQIRANVDPGHALTESDIRQYANRWVVSELLYQEAQQRGYDGSEEVTAKVAEARKQLTIAELLERDVYGGIGNDIPPSDIATYYQSHTAEFLLAETVTRLSVAVFAGMEAANRFRTAALGENGWEASVRLFGSDTSGMLVSYTDSAFYSQSSLYPPELWKVAGALGMMEVSFPVKTSVGYVVLRSLGEFKSGGTAPLAYVQEQIRGRLTMERRQQRYQQYIQDLRAKHAVQMMTAVLDSSSGER